MYVDKNTLLFEDLDEYDIITLKVIDQVISIGKVPWEHQFVETWFNALDIEKDRLLVASTVLHIRVLQSITNWVFKNGWNTHGWK